eukprot:CAMPEP_0179287308 /NCGR_PEP_ID=MMETSP0797-20121207/40199_1 /TAXON_ID=47934 /ORGANISM="Dinophysis acuminata, Strain DAEP01" /LENGTH=92 /DNA_ID=CAMNT_0020996237 /DNA_START=104 /DNA_END=382 /DNA_ORIENTATION=+
MAAMKEFEGFNNAMPGPNAPTSKRGYVILRQPAEWSSPPCKITVLQQTVDVEMETYDFVARGLDLPDGLHAATVSLENGNEEVVNVKVITVC